MAPAERDIFYDVTLPASDMVPHLRSLLKRDARERERSARADSFEAQWLPANELLMPSVSQERDTSLSTRRRLKREKMLCHIVMCWKNKQHNRFALVVISSLSLAELTGCKSRADFCLKSAAAPLWLPWTSTCTHTEMLCVPLRW